MGLTAHTMPTLATAISAFAALIVLSAALHDVAFRTIPNWIPAVLLVAGGIVQVMNGTLLPGLLAAFLIFSGTAFCWHRGWFGGGDVKLLAAVALLVPPPLALNLLLYVALAGGVLALLYLALAQMVRKPSGIARPPGLLHRIFRVERFRISRRGPLPYASAIAAGAFLVMFKG